MHIFSGVPILDDHVDAENRKHEQAYLEGIRTLLGSLTTAKIQCSVIDGPVAAALAEHAKRSTPI